MAEFAQLRGLEIVDEDIPLPKTNLHNNNNVMEEFPENILAPEDPLNKLKEVENSISPANFTSILELNKFASGLVKIMINAGVSKEQAQRTVENSIGKLNFQNKNDKELVQEIKTIVSNIHKSLEIELNAKTTKTNSTSDMAVIRSSKLAIPASEELETVITEVDPEIQENIATTIENVNEPDININKQHANMAESFNPSNFTDVESDEISKAVIREKNGEPKEKANETMVDSVKVEIKPLSDVNDLLDKIDKLEKFAQQAQFNLAEKSEYSQIKDLAEKITNLQSRVNGESLKHENDDGIKNILIKRAEEKLLPLLTKTEELLQTLTKEVTEKSKNFNEYWGEETANLRDALGEDFDQDVLKSKPVPEADRKTGWWNNDFQKKHLSKRNGNLSVEESQGEPTPIPAVEDISTPAEVIRPNSETTARIPEGDEIAEETENTVEKMHNEVLKMVVEITNPSSLISLEDRETVKAMHENSERMITEEKSPLVILQALQNVIDFINNLSEKSKTFEQLKTVYETTEKQLNIINLERVKLNKALFENLSKKEEDWVLRERKGIWLEMDLKDLEYIRAKRNYLQNYKDLTVALGTDNEEILANQKILNPWLTIKKNETAITESFQTETTKKRFTLLRKILKSSLPIITASGVLFADNTGDGSFSKTGHQPKTPMTSMDKAPIAPDDLVNDIQLESLSDSKIAFTRPTNLPETEIAIDQVPPAMVPPPKIAIDEHLKTATTLTHNDDNERGFSFPTDIKNPEGEINAKDIFSPLATDLNHDLGVILEYPDKLDPNALAALERFDTDRFKIETPHDVYWNIMEGQTKAGELPFLAKIDARHKQEVIDLVRDRIDDDHELRINLGFGQSSADQTYIGEEININLLNKIAEEVAMKYGYLLPENKEASEVVLDPTITKPMSGNESVVKKEAEKTRASVEPIITDSVMGQFKSNFPGGPESYKKSFNFWVQTIEGFTAGDGGWFTNLFGPKSTFSELSKMTIAEIKYLADLEKSSVREFQAEISGHKLPIVAVRAWLNKFRGHENSKQLTDLKPTDKFLKLTSKIFVLEQLKNKDQHLPDIK